ncbi:MAG: type II toxin-antitoxin system VapB family antitoxin [Aeromicrobium sp.]|uniref:type II toxin-antitoxin system VapB family antitoxin n=1 Tax=Aeromicrobium sp. TaxID=1871063 RepID=UPI0039E3BBFB
MAKTLIEIDDQLMDDAMRLSGNTTKKATVTDALTLLVRQANAREYIRSLRDGMAGDLDDPEVIALAQR